MGLKTKGLGKKIEFLGTGLMAAIIVYLGLFFELKCDTNFQKQYRGYKIDAQYQEALWENKSPLKGCKDKNDSINALYLLGYENKIKFEDFSRNEKNKILENLAKE